MSNKLILNFLDSKRSEGNIIDQGRFFKKK